MLIIADRHFVIEETSKSIIISSARPREPDLSLSCRRAKRDTTKKKRRLAAARAL